MARPAIAIVLDNSIAHTTLHLTCEHRRLAELVEQPLRPPRGEDAAEAPVGASEAAVVPVQDGVPVEQVVDAGVLEDLVAVRGSRHSPAVGWYKSAHHSRNGPVKSGNPT